MRICRFDLASDPTPRLGVVEGGVVRDVTAVTGAIPAPRWPFSPGDPLIAHLGKLKPMLADAARGAVAFPLAEVLLRSPVSAPAKILCGAGNWPEHQHGDTARTMRDFGWLLKTSNALAGEADGVKLPAMADPIFYEAEIVAVIGTGGRDITAAAAPGHIAGYTIGLDMTAQWGTNFSHNKCHDGFGVVGPWLVTADEIPDPGVIAFEFDVNGEIKQKDRVANLVMSLTQLVEYASEMMTLVPGDLIFSGTPAGVGAVVPGDVMHARFDIIGEMTVKVRAA